MAINDTFGMAALTADLTTDEGRRPDLYKDSLGNMTIGIGHEILGRPFTDEEINLIFTTDVSIAADELDAHMPWWRTLPKPQQRVMLNLCFNLGWPRLAQFVRFLAAMKLSDWPAAADELRNSVWFKQVGGRGPRMIARLTQPE